MKKQEQDKLWAELSEETKKKIRKDYNDSIKNLPIEESKRGKIYSYECLFGEHNLQYALTYKDVSRELFGYDNEKQYGSFCCPTFSDGHCDKLSAINALLCVAKFLNKNEDGSDWVPDWNYVQDKWYLAIEKGKVKVDYHDDGHNSHIVYFRSIEIANKAIQILGEDVIRTALTTNY